MRDRVASVVALYGDALLAAALTALLLAQTAMVEAPMWQRLVASAGVVALGIGAAVRARMPLLLLSLTLVTAIVGGLLSSEFGDLEASGLFFLLAIYSAAAHTGGRGALVAAALTIVVGVMAAAGDPEELNFAAIVFFTLITGAPWIAGRIVRRRRVNEARLELEKAEAEAAIVAERSRIARELHDVVAHAISVVVLQARGGRRLLDCEPEEARRAFDTIERTSQHALDEMRRLVGLLRTDDELALAPQPSLERLDALVQDVRQAGLPVELEIHGDAVDLPPGVDLSAYRIVQEALTNALKHAGPARARVVLRYEPGEIGLEISDDGVGAATGDGAGHGLTGIRERVTVYGGRLETGPAAEGGYTVRACLPYASER